jgi:CspA family cold shock protein
VHAKPRSCGAGGSSLRYPTAIFASPAAAFRRVHPRKDDETARYWSTLPQRRNTVNEDHPTLQTTGTVKWFNATKGYGFIQPDDGGQDAFVHISAVERAGLDTLRDGQRVSYELVRGKNGKSSAENLQLKD